MFKSALLVVTKPLSQLRVQIPAYLAEINRLVSESAYIHIHPDALKLSKDSCKFDFLPFPFSTEIRNIIKELYISSSRACSNSNIDVRVLVGHFMNSDVKINKYQFHKPCDIVLIDQELVQGDITGTDLLKSISEWFSVESEATLKTITVGESIEDNSDVLKKRKLQSEENPQENELLDQHPHVVLGGTFDRLHVGHKLLLSEGCCLATGKLTVGVTDGEMNNKKMIPELMETAEHRKAVVKQFLEEVKPALVYDVVTITDGYGPTIHDPDMDLIVLSQETKKGGEMINNEREKKGFKTLSTYTIELVEDACHNEYEEEKISSSSQRKRLLGTLYNPLTRKSHLSDSPYIVGVTGGIASGKSSVCKRLSRLGAAIVDCDKLGHTAYVKGTPGFSKVVEAFGADIVGEDGEVDRKALGKIVFGNKDELQKLNQLVWPEIARMAEDQIQTYAQEAQEVVILDAAVLLEAGWDDMCHEVWTTMVPKPEAVKRIVERNNLTEEQAEQRVNSQISNHERVQRSNVILCTLWEYEYTQQQVEKAWRLLQGRLPAKVGQDVQKMKSNI